MRHDPFRRAVSVAVALVMVATAVVTSSSPVAAQPSGSEAGASPLSAPATPSPAPPAAPSPPRRPDPAPQPGTARTVPPFDPAKAKLIERRRTADVFENPDRTRTVRAYAGLANWQDKAGRWHQIDPTLVADGDRGFKNRSGEVTFSFAPTADASSVVRASTDDWSVSFGLEGARRGGTPGVKGSTIRYPDVADGVALEYVVGAEFMKELVVLERPLAAGASATFRFPLNVSRLTPRTEPDGTIAFVDAAGATVAAIPPGIMYDASGDPAAGVEHASAPVSTRLVREGSRWVVEVSAERAWLDDPGRVYPVAVDPQFWAGANPPAADAFVGSGCGNCNYNGAGQLDGGAYTNKIGYSWYNNGWWEWRTYARYDVSAANNQDILRAAWYGNFYTTSTPNSTFVLRVAPAWNEWGITWNNQPGGCCGEILGTASTGQVVARDMRSWVHNWTHGIWGNTGIEIDNYGQGQYLRMGAAEQIERRSLIDVTYNTLANTPTSPTPAYQWINTTTPQLCANYSDPNGDQGYLRFDVYNAAGSYKGTITTPGWTPSGGRPCATVPPGWLAEGYAYYHAFAFDGYNWSTGYADVWVRIDTTPPPAAGLSSATHPDPNAWYPSRSFSASWSAPADASGISGYALGAPTASATAEAGTTVTQTNTAHSSTVAGDGRWYLNLRARDGAGNWGANARLAFNADATGASAPSLSVAAPHVCHTATTPAAWSTDNTPTFTWSATDISGIDGYSYALNQTENFTLDDTSEGPATSYTPPARADGTWWFHVKARNGAGLWGATARCKVLIDAGVPAAPVARSTSHPDAMKWYANRTTAFAWEPGASTSPVVSYAHDPPDRLAERDPAPVSDGPDRTTSYTTDADGAWWFHVRSQNAAGSWGLSAHVKVNVDITPPEAPAAVVSATHVPGVAVSNDRATVVWTPGSDATSGVAGYSWEFNQSEATPANDSVDGDAATLTATSAALAPGTWWFHVKTLDRAGNASGDKAFGPIVVDPNGPLGLAPIPIGEAVATSDELGLEQFYPYARHDLGTATGYVHLRTGNLVVAQDDVDIPGQGLNVVVRRTYNAQDPTDPDGVGAGWRLSVADVEAGLEGLDGVLGGLDVTKGLVVADLVSAVGMPLGQVLELVDGDGTTHRFVRQGPAGSRWSAPPGVSLRVLEDTDGSGAVVAYRFVRPDGVTYRAENLKGVLQLPTATWRVTSVTDRSANQLTYHYATVVAGVVPKARLSRITHSRPRPDTGEVVEFRYGVEGLLDAIVSLPGLVGTDPASGQPVEWERRTTLERTGGRLTRAVEAAGSADERATGFGYDGAGRLDAVVDGTDKTTRFAYTLDAGVARTTTVTDRRGKPWGYAYGPADAAGARTTTATTPAGAATTYQISGRGPVNGSDRRVAGGNIVAITDAGADAGPVAQGFSWFANRLVTSTEGSASDATSATTSFAYNDLGLLTRVSEPAPNRPGTPGLPAGAPTTEVSSTLSYRFAAPWRLPGCTAPDPGADPVTNEGYCEAVADLAQVRLADNHGDALRRVRDFAYADDTGRMTTVVERASGTGAPGGADRTTALSYYDRGGLRAIDGPRSDVADVTTFGDPADAAYGGYDPTGMPTRLTDAAGRTKTWAYTPYGRIARAVDRDGAATATVYDRRDNALRVTDPAGHVTEYRYDGDDRKVSETSPRGTASLAVGDFTLAWVYDANGWMTGASGPGATASDPRVATSTAWNDDGTKASETSAIGATTTYAFWPNRALRSATAPAGTGQSAVSEYFYDLAGRVRLERGPATNAAGDRPETETTYAPDGAVVAVAATSPVAGQKALTRTAYGAHGEAIEVRGPRSVAGVEAATVSSFNAFGELVASRRRADATRWLDTFYGYDAAGNQTCQVQPTGAGGGSEAACTGAPTAGQLVARFSYDALGQLAAQTADPVNPRHTVDYQYSGEGQQTLRRDLVDGVPARTTAFAYNVDNTRRSMVVTDHATGRTLATCNWAAGAQPHTGYDPDGNLVATRTLEGTQGCDGGTALRAQNFTWDHRGWLAGTTQSVRSPATAATVARTQTFTHNADGTLKQATHDGRTITYGTYSPGGRLEALSDWRGRTTTFSTFASGVPAAACLGRTGTSGCDGGAARASFDYRPDGSPSELVWRARTAGGAERLVWAHTAIAYDVGGLRGAEAVQVEQPGGSTVSGTAAFSYDLADRLVGWTSPFPEPGTAAPSSAYSLDHGGNIVAEEVRTGATLRSRADSTYPSGRLASRRTETYGGTLGTVVDAETFGYDGLGQETLRSTTRQVGALPALPSAQRATGYDPAGHTALADDQRPATADPAVAASPDVSYVYDTTDRLVARTESAETTLYFYWGTSGTLAEETDGAGATKVRYLVDEDDQVLAQEAVTRPGGSEVETWTWLLSDATANVGTHIDNAGAVVEQAAYDPYGKPDKGGSARASGATGPNSSLGYQSALTDKVTGAVVLGPRQYDPTTSRFTTPDTFVASALDLQLGADELTGNRYLFAAANPVSFYDDGHGIGLPKIKLPSPLKAVKQLAKKALPFVPVVGAGIEAVSIATGRDWLEGGRKMSGGERLARTGLLAGGAVVGVGVAKVTRKVVEKVATKAAARKAAGAPNTTALKLTNGRQFETLSSQPISGVTRSAHRATANKQLLGQLEADPALRQFYDDFLGTDVVAHMRSGRSGLRNPPGTEWHHPTWDPDSMLLLRRGVHRHPDLQGILHPGPSGSGGFAQHFGGGF